jgi:hypothetical protein
MAKNDHELLITGKQTKNHLSNASKLTANSITNLSSFILLSGAA